MEDNLTAVCLDVMCWNVVHACAYVHGLWALGACRTVLASLKERKHKAQAAAKAVLDAEAKANMLEEMAAKCPQLMDLVTNIRTVKLPALRAVEQTQTQSTEQAVDPAWPENVSNISEQSLVKCEEALKDIYSELPRAPISDTALF